MIRSVTVIVLASQTARSAGSGKLTSVVVAVTVDVRTSMLTDQQLEDGAGMDEMTLVTTLVRAGQLVTVDEQDVTVWVWQASEILHEFSRPVRHSSVFCSRRVFVSWCGVEYTYAGHIYGACDVLLRSQ